MPAALAPDYVVRIYSDDFAGWEMMLEDFFGLVVFFLAEGWHEDDFVANVEIGVAGGEHGI